MPDLVPLYPRPPAQVAVYVEVLGYDLALDFLLAFGGAVIYLPKQPQGRSEIEALIGRENLLRLSAEDHRLPRRVPLAKKWVASMLAAKGQSVSAIARRLHASDVSVRKWIAGHAP